MRVCATSLAQSSGAGPLKPLIGLGLRRHIYGIADDHQGDAVRAQQLFGDSVDIYLIDRSD
jgi:hypothetical protein